MPTRLQLRKRPPLMPPPGQGLVRLAKLARTHPRERVERLALIPQFEVQAGILAASGAADRGKDLPRLNRVADAAQQRFVVAVDRQEPITVIQNHQVAKATQPVGEYDPTGGHRVYLGPSRRTDKQPFPGGSAGPRLAVLVPARGSEAWPN